MKYIVQISETLVHRVEIEADTAKQAREQVINDYNIGDIILTADNYAGDSVQFEVIGNEQE